MTGMEHPIALLRLREHLSTRELAEQSGIPEPTILAIEAGEIALQIGVAFRLAPALDVATADLVAAANQYEARRAFGGVA